MTNDPPDSQIQYPPKRPPIVRSEGLTDTERHLAKLVDRSFLNLWSYPNLFRDQRESPTAGGKELCDLLVVCGDDVLIFSEKHYTWPDRDLDVAWPRWFKSAVKKSVDQVLGAERWITKFPNRIFLDPQCTKQFPIPLPSPERRRIHGIVVARGAGAACRSYFKGGTGSFAIDTSILGDAHWNSKIGPVKPFWVGDLNPGGTFMHVLDDGSLDVLLSELDTITDFTDYLIKKERFLRSKYFGLAHGEEDLYAYYAMHMDQNDQHDFVEDGGKPWPKGKIIAIDGTHYTNLLKNPQYQLKKEADKDSYTWDKLILNFTEPMMDGTSIQPREAEYDLSKSEIAVREMALEGRFERRSHGAAILDAIRTFNGSKGDMFMRIMMPQEGKQRRPVGFFFFISTYGEWFQQNGGYDAYRQMRMNYSELYAKAILVRYPHLERIVGISVESPNERGSSEDIIYAKRWNYSDDEAKEILEQCDQLGIMRSDMKMRPVQENEYPDVPDDALMLAFDSPSPRKSGYRNRKERRAAAAKARKRKK